MEGSARLSTPPCPTDWLVVSSKVPQELVQGDTDRAARRRIRLEGGGFREGRP